MRGRAESAVLDFELLNFQVDETGLLVGNELDSSNGDGFLCCASIVVKEGFIGISVSF